MAKQKFEVRWEEKHQAIVEVDVDKLKSFLGDQVSKEAIVDEAERLAIEEAKDTYREVIDIETFQIK